MTSTPKYLALIFLAFSFLIPATCTGVFFFSVFFSESDSLDGGLSEVSLPKGTIVIKNKSAGDGLPLPGGASDGYTFLLLQIPPSEIVVFARRLENSSAWRSLPLSSELSKNQKWLQPSIAINETIPIAATSSGYYMFVDFQEVNKRRKSKSADEVAKPFHERHSLNFKFGLFNDKDGKLYLWRLDT